MATICKFDVVITVPMKIKLLSVAKYLPTFWLIVVLTSSEPSCPRKFKHVLDSSVLKKEAYDLPKRNYFSVDKA
jgi:hypothetical protein